MHTDKAFADTLVLFGECARAAAERAGDIGDESERVRRVTSVIKAMARFFWFTIEFGLMKGERKGEIKAYGSGLLSSYGEIEHCIESPEVQRWPFQLEWVVNQYFEIDKYQPLLFVVDSFDHLFSEVERLVRWVKAGKLDNVSPGEPSISEADLASFLTRHRCEGRRGDTHCSFYADSVHDFHNDPSCARSRARHLSHQRDRLHRVLRVPTPSSRRTITAPPGAISWSATVAPKPACVIAPSYLLVQDKLRFVLTSALGPEGPIAEHVQSMATACATWRSGSTMRARRIDAAIAHGARSAQEPTGPRATPTAKSSSPAIHTYGDTIHSIVERRNYRGLFLPGFVPVTSAVRARDDRAQVRGPLRRECRTRQDERLGEVLRGRAGLHEHSDLR